MPREPSETRPHVAFLTSREARLDWQAIAAVGRRQHGVISLSQLVACGFTPSGVQKLAKAGKLHRIHRGVYALSPAALPRAGNLLAAVLACGSGTLLASRSVAGHYGLITNSSSFIDVISPHRVRKPGIRARQVPELDPRDRTKHLEIPCTSVARTLLDLAAFGRPGELRSALEQAEVLGLFDLDAISDVIRRNEGRRGVRRLRSSLAAMTAAGAELRSRIRAPVPADLTVRRAGRAAEQSRHRRCPADRSRSITTGPTITWSWSATATFSIRTGVRSATTAGAIAAWRRSASTASATSGRTSRTEARSGESCSRLSLPYRPPSREPAEMRHHVVFLTSRGREGLAAVSRPPRRADRPARGRPSTGT